MLNHGLKILFLLSSLTVACEKEAANYRTHQLYNDQDATAEQQSEKAPEHGNAGSESTSSQSQTKDNSSAAIQINPAQDSDNNLEAPLKESALGWSGDHFKETVELKFIAIE